MDYKGKSYEKYDYNEREREEWSRPAMMHTGGGDGLLLETRNVPAKMSFSR